MNDRHAERQEEAKRALERVARDTETLGSSSLARTATRVAHHFKADDEGEDDAVELLGKRIGRTLGFLAFVGLAIYLFVTYVLK